MLRKFSVSLLLGLVSLGTANLAHAGWGSWGGGSSGGYGSDGYGSFGGSTGGSYGSYGSGGASSGSWGGYASNGSHGGWGRRGHHHGPLARLFHRWHQHKQARHVTAYASHGSWGGGSWGGSWNASSGGSWGGSWSGSSGGSWGGSSGGYASSGGSYGGWSYGSHGSVGGAVYGGGEVIDGVYEEGTPPAPPAPMQSEPMPPAPEDEGASASTQKGILVVSVPADAKILVNGEETRSTGSRRRYVSHGLKQGESYRYVVKAITERNGEPIEQTKVAMLRAGRTTAIDFDFSGESVVETSLTVSVPKDAKVYLSGHETTTTGQQRRFSTTRIEEGQKWADYVVKVTVDRDGRTLTQERRVTLNGGDQAELNFEFADAELAAVR